MLRKLSNCLTRFIWIFTLAAALSACGKNASEQNRNGGNEEQTQKRQQEGDDGDDPTDTPPPTVHGEEEDPTECVVDTPRFHFTNARTIANLDGDFGNTPYQEGADLADPLIPMTLTSPGVFTARWDLTTFHASLAAAAGPGAQINSNMHLFYVEFPVNSLDLCDPFAWETGESWVKGTAYAQNRTTGVFTKRTLADFTKFPVAGAVAVPNTEVFKIRADQWLRGTGRADANFPEAWVFVDPPGLYRSHVGQTEAGNYINIRLNIREGGATGAIRGTALFRIAQRLQLDGTFTSQLGGSSGAGSVVLNRPPQLDPNLTNGVPVNAPATIQSLYGNDPNYVGRP